MTDAAAGATAGAGGGPVAAAEPGDATRLAHGSAAPLRSRGVPANLLAWAAFALVHSWLIALCLFVPGSGTNDVTFVYRDWVEQALSGGAVVGIDISWVYPIVALAPMLLAGAVGGADGILPAWLGLVVVLNAGAFAFLVRAGRRSKHQRTALAPAIWWLTFLLALGPIALSRIDAVTVALGIIGVLLLSRAPAFGSAILTIATWVKVWPAVLLAAGFVAFKTRGRILLIAALISLGIVGVALLLGSGGRVFGFITEQTGRGLQIEAPITTVWMWAAFAGVGRASVYFDREIITYQVTGAGVDAAAAIMTPILVVATMFIIVLGMFAIRAGSRSSRVLPPLALALVVALIAFNKVGSPQFVGWIAVPVLVGLVTAQADNRAASFRFPAIVGLGTAALTQVLYPFLYDRLVTLEPAMLVALTARNILEFVLLGWAVTQLWRAMRPRPAMLDIGT